MPAGETTETVKYLFTRKVTSTMCKHSPGLPPKVMSFNIKHGEDMSVSQMTQPKAIPAAELARMLKPARTQNYNIVFTDIETEDKRKFEVTFLGAVMQDHETFDATLVIEELLPNGERVELDYDYEFYIEF